MKKQINSLFMLSLVIIIASVVGICFAVTNPFQTLATAKTFTFCYLIPLLIIGFTLLLIALSLYKHAVESEHFYDKGGKETAQQLMNFELRLDEKFKQLTELICVKTVIEKPAPISKKDVVEVLSPLKREIEPPKQSEWNS
jgi:type III secretory pathway component EscS